VATGWQDGIPYDINTFVDSDTYVFSVSDINHSGRIVGYCISNGLLTAFLLTPIPEPASLALLAATLPLLSRRRRDK